MRSPQNPFPSPAHKFFHRVTAYPRTLITLGALLVIGAGSFLPTLTTDTSAEAFIPKDHASVVHRDEVKELFGLSDPIVIAVIDDDADGVFDPDSLGLVHWLTQEIQTLEKVNPHRVTSLATENDIIGTTDGLLVEPFFESSHPTQAESRQVREAIEDFPLYLGSLVARDFSATLVVAELYDPNDGDLVYQQVLELVDRAPTTGQELHVAGEGAVRGYLGRYIDSDARRLNPLAALIISFVLFLAYRTVRGVILPNLLVLAAVSISVGAMAAAGVPFYVITNALPVLLIGISVADGIHILGQYYEEQTLDPTAGSRELAVRAMAEMWRPVTITSATDIAGLLGLALASFMPPMRAFGVFASIGVAAAWLFSLFVLPNILVLLKPQSSPAISTRGVGSGQGDVLGFDAFGRLTGGIGRWVARHPAPVLALGLLIAGLGLIGLGRLEVNEARIENFRHSEPLYQADQAINQRFDGTNTLDVMIEANSIEGLFEVDHLAKIEALQQHLESHERVRGTTSMADYLKQMNRALHEDDPSAYELPGSAQAAAQYFLLYSASGDPTDFEDIVDYDYRQANVRASLDTGLYSHNKPVVEDLQRYVDRHFGEQAGDLQAKIAGRVNVDYHWIEGLASSHFRGLFIALTAAWLMASLSFRSMVAGALAIIPVVLAILWIYAVMGFTGIWLGVGTSMFAAIAIGIAVDFAVHTLDRLIVLVRHEGLSIEDAFARLFPSTGRALLFNFTAVLLGFGVLTTSQVPPLVRFGSLVAVAVSSSFIASLTVLPALVAVLRPAFLRPKKASAMPSNTPIEQPT